MLFPWQIERFHEVFHLGVGDRAEPAERTRGVATSGLEMSRNAMHLSWTAEEADQKLHGIMVSIHTAV